MDGKSMVRGWISLTVMQSFGTALQAMDQKALADKLYTVAGTKEVSLMFCRLFGLWHIVMGLARLLTVFYFDERLCHFFTLGTYALSCIHFASEALVFKTTDILGTGVMANLFMSVFSMILIGYNWNNLFDSRPMTRQEREEMMAKEHSRVEFAFPAQKRTILQQKKQK